MVRFIVVIIKCFMKIISLVTDLIFCYSFSKNIAERGH